MKEIERKYIVKLIPPQLPDMPYSYIEQSYLAIGIEEVRIRKKKKENETKYFLTIKKGKGLSREEIETEISESTYNQLNKNSKPIRKIRYTMPYNDFILEIDKYLDIDLIVAEIEFKSEQEAKTFIPPDWLGRDITEDKVFKNQSIWEMLNQNN